MPTYEELQKELQKATLYGSIIALMSKDIMTKENLDEAIRLMGILKGSL